MNGDVRVELTVEQAMQAFDALQRATHHLCDRDRMNAHIHLAEPRWSPLTELVSNAATMLQEALQDQAIIGASIQHPAPGPRGGAMMYPPTSLQEMPPATPCSCGGRLDDPDAFHTQHACFVPVAERPPYSAGLPVAWATGSTSWVCWNQEARWS